MNDVRGSWLKGSHIGKMSIYSRPGKIYYCTGLTDFYSLAAQGNRSNNYDIVQMSFNQLKWASSKRVPIKLTNTENIKMFFCRATESANVGWVYNVPVSGSFLENSGDNQEKQPKHDSSIPCW